MTAPFHPGRQRRMRRRTLGRVGASLFLLVAAGAGFAEAQTPRAPAPPPAGATPPAIGCPSLANLRILLRQAGGEARAAAAILVDPKADAMSCILLDRATVTAIADHAGLNGSDYDCVAIAGTSVCQWTVAGTVVPVDPARKAKKALPEKPKR